MASSNIEAQFHDAMISVYTRAGEQCGYWATRFLQMVRRRGGLDAAKTLLQRPGISPGLLALSKCGRLDLSAEALVLRPEFKSLFSDEERAVASHAMAIARTRTVKR